MKEAPMPAARSTDPDTSHAAARSAYNPTEVQAHLLAIIRVSAPAGSKGLTDDEIYPKYIEAARRHGWAFPSPQSLRSRRAELVRADQVRHSGEYGHTIRRRQSRRWAATS
jgi:hypothetical protein